MIKKILSIEIRLEQDVVLARQRAKQIASLLDFDAQEQTRIATALSEIARNAFKYAGRGHVDFAIETIGGSPNGCPNGYPNGYQCFIVCVSDEGPGIASLDAILNGSYVSPSGMGLGIIGSKRLMDLFEIETAPGRGTRVKLGKNLPHKGALLSMRDVGRITEDLVKRYPASPLEELQNQNRELLRTMEELRAQQAKLVELNEQLENANRELEDTNRGVVALYAELDERADSLQRASETKTRFLSNMTHEFRTPLNSILSLSRILLDGTDGPLNEEQQKQVSFIRRSAEDLSELVNDLLDLAKVAAGKIVVRSAEFQVDELFGALRGMLKPLLAANSSVNLVFEGPSELPVLETDEGKVSQILRNLISNALKYTNEGEVRVSARLAQGNTIVFEVADTGIGIAKEDQERIFEEFTQIESPAQSRSKGTGLGLALTRKLASLLGGSIELKSEVGRGSTFYAILPIVYRGPEEVSYVPELSRKLDPSRTPVLVIEDNRELLFIYDKMLKNSGYQVIPARTLKEARLALADIRPAAIISDIMLESESTWNFLGELKRDERTREIPLIVITMVENEKKALALGADAFHLKPISGEWLMGKLREFTKSQEQECILIIDDDEIARYILRGLLAGSRYPLIEAASGAEGLKLAREMVPRAIFLDLSMPGMSGAEVLQQLKEDPVTRAIPVIINTSKPLDECEYELLSRGSVTILSKGIAGPRTHSIEHVRSALSKAGLRRQMNG